MANMLHWVWPAIEQGERRLVELPRKNSIFYIPGKGWFGNLAQCFVHGAITQAPARQASVPMSMAVILFIGESLTRQSSWSLPIISSIRLLGWWLGARKRTFTSCMAQLPFQLINLALQVPFILCVGNMTLPTRMTFGGMICAYTPLMAFSSFRTLVGVTMLGAP